MTPFAATRAPTPTLPTLPSTAPPPPRPAPAGAPGRSSAKGGRRWRGGRLLDRLARELGPLPAARRRPADIASSRVPFGPLRQRLVRSQERELRQPLDPRVRGAALDRLVLAHLRLVASVARGYRGRGVEWDDLLQDGALGLMLAADLYRPERGEFRPFALLVIAHHLARAVADYAPLVSTPVPWAQAVARFRAYRWRFVQGHGRVPDDAEVWEHLQLLPDEWLVLRQAVAAWSRRRPVGPRVTCPRSPDPQQGAAARELPDAVEAVLASLPNPRWVDVVRRRFGLGGRPQETLEQIGQALRMTREGVRLIEAQALDALRHPIRARRLQPYLQ